MKSVARSIRFLSSTLGPVLVAAQLAHAQGPVWIHQIGTIGQDKTTAAVPDGAGNVFLCGNTTDNLAGYVGAIDAWLALDDSAGNHLWIRQFGTSATDQATGVAPDGAGGAYITGSTYGNLGATNLGYEDAWLARYDAAGNQLWLVQFGTVEDEQPWCAASDGAGGVYVGGHTEGSLGGANAGGEDAWLARYDSAGVQLWVRQIGVVQDDEIWSAAPDGSGGVYVCGNTSGSLGGTGQGFFDAWMARYDSSGNQLWIRQIGSPAEDRASNAVADGSGGLYVAGWTWADLGGPSAGYVDAWTARYDGAGNQLWIRQLGTAAGEYLHAATSDGAGGVIVVGRTDGNLGNLQAGWWDIWFARYDGAGDVLWIGQFGSSATDWPQAAAPDGSGGVYLGGWTQGDLGGPLLGQEDAWFAHCVAPSPMLCEPGVGGVIDCPCANPPAGLGRGCNNSSASGGARLFVSGAAKLTLDTLFFTAIGERASAPSVLLQGTSEQSPGVVFGQGVGCVGGTLRRLYVRAASGGILNLPDVGAGDLTISTRSAAIGDPILAGQSRWYAVYYRDPIVLGGCPSANTFNTGPTMRIDWQP